MISEKRILANKAKFQETNEKYGIFTKELEEFLGEDFYYSPASPSLDMYGCYYGGLVDHLLKVCKYSVQLNNLLPEQMRVDTASLIRTVFLAQIGKTYLFKQNESDWHRDTLGKLFEYRDDELIVMTVGERSVYYANKYGIKLTEEEYQAIINSDKEGPERSKRWVSKPLGHIIKLGFEMAVLEEKNVKK